MIRILLARALQGFKTIPFPKGDPPELPSRFPGLPVIDASRCRPGCTKCENACPTGAISAGDGMSIDLGKCLFCTDCIGACPEGAISFSREYRLSVRSRDDLIVTANQQLRRADALSGQLRSILGRSLRLRVVSAGGCNACESDVNVLNTIGWDLSRFGIQYVASPRHADGIIVTGPVTKHMETALKKTYDAIPEPKIVVAVGACAISGGPFIGHDETDNGAESTVPVDLYIPGCPPHPLTILEGLLRLIGRIS
ncbi:4Fe-4S dicluster domain-containing protein [Marispirochaeta aestuarii]|uniref:NADH-quinone oxidoreductase subunit B family protein n=1 Tax=Marispirochaeta aestuarii TaxID=1963862 RepID=UPI002ABE1626|nr:4Fe-4S dicluster domain-containing protein [Marispirochaeta aestuarii]